MTEILLYLAPHDATQKHIASNSNHFTNRWGGFHITIGATIKGDPRFVNKIVDQLHSKGKLNCGD